MLTWLLPFLQIMTVQVPNVVGLSYEQAKTHLQAKGFAELTAYPGHCARPVGVVCRQNPQAGREVDIREPVRLIVSRGRKREDFKPDGYIP